MSTQFMERDSSLRTPHSEIILQLRLERAGLPLVGSLRSWRRAGSRQRAGQ